ncbi:MAG: decaprenyl-phosphate phosphoribosyltransferase [Bacteroidota bacterium]
MQLKYIIASMRLHQWIKNLFIFAALVFSIHLRDINDILLTIGGFFCFSFASSGVYLFNDIADLESDKLHPTKSKRPLPSGKITTSTAWMSSVILFLIGGLAAFALRPAFGVIIVLYVVMNVCYSYVLKNVVILDVMTISAGFVLRVLGGALLIDVPPSEWLIMCTILLSLFLGFSKRRHELTLLDSHANSHRSVLEQYSPYFLDQMIGIVTASTVMSYALYTMSEETIHKFNTRNLIYTLPFVLYGIFRYLYLVHKSEEGGNPSKLALTDKPLLTNIILWIISIIVIIYH